MNAMKDASKTIEPQDDGQPLPDKTPLRQRLPASKPMRQIIGWLCILGGVFGFLPVLGFWMIPLGLAILSLDSPRIRLARQRMTRWWRHRRQR